MGQRFKLGWKGGVNLLVDPKALRDDQLANGKNCWPTLEGLLAKRHAVAFERVVVTDPSTPYRPLAMFVPDPITGFDFIMHYADDSGNEYLRAFRGDSDTEATCPVVKINTKPNNDYRPISFTNYKGRVLAVGGNIEGVWQLINAIPTQLFSPTSAPSIATAGWQWVQATFDWNYQRSQDIGQSQNSGGPVKPQVCCQYRGRMVYANLGVGMGNLMVFADRSTWALQATFDARGTDAFPDLYQFPLWTQIGSDVLAANGHSFELTQVQGETIRAMQEISIHNLTTGLSTALLVLTERSAVIITGEVAETTDTGTTYNNYLGDIVAAKVNFDCGCAGPYAITRTPTGTFWANGEDVFALYSGAPEPVPVGTNIRPALRACPPNLQNFWHMAYAEGVVYLSVATQDSTNPLMLVSNHWRLDTRPTPGDNQGVMIQPQNPDNARWWGPQDYSSLATMGVNSGASSAGCCIISKRIVTINQDIVYGAMYTDRDDLGSHQAIFLMSFNRVYDGRDVPYLELSSARAWAASDTVAKGDVIMPSPLARNGALFLATTGGVTGLTEPSWITNSTIADNTVVWEELELLNTGIPWRTPNSLGAANPGRIAFEPDFKEYDLGTQMQDKLLKRADVAIYSSVRQQVWLDILGNGGNLRFYAGPSTIGDFTLGRSPAYNDLGLMPLDSSALAQEFQVRQLRPGDLTRTKPDSVLPGIIRARAIQPRLREGDGFIIDDSNDYIVWCSFLTGAGLSIGPYQAQITHGYYDNVDDLMAVVVNALNSAAQAVFGSGTDVWTYTSVFPFNYGVTRYMTSLKMAFDARNSDRLLAFLCAFDPTEAATFNGVTFYVNRCMRLLAMLGFDTSGQYAAADGVVIQDDSTTAMNVVGEQQTPLLASPTQIFGVQATPYTRSPVISVTEVEMELVLKPGRPMPITGRIS